MAWRPLCLLGQLVSMPIRDWLDIRIVRGREIRNGSNESTEFNSWYLHPHPERFWQPRSGVREAGLFQEWYLARRVLVFTDQQVYYICPSSSFSEDLYLGSIPPVTTEALVTQKQTASALLHHLPTRDLPLTAESGWTEYQRLVESYTPRELTDESETLLAISGLLNNLHRASRNRFLCGISIGLFHDALFWVPVSGIDFRRMSETRLYPTWSWAGWKEL
jgi:hypothetical protein